MVAIFNIGTFGVITNHGGADRAFKNLELRQHHTSREVDEDLRWDLEWCRIFVTPWPKSV